MTKEIFAIYTKSKIERAAVRLSSIPDNIVQQAKWKKQNKTEKPKVVRNKVTPLRWLSDFSQAPNSHHQGTSPWNFLSISWFLWAPFSCR